MRGTHRSRDRRCIMHYALRGACVRATGSHARGMLRTHSCLCGHVGACSRGAPAHARHSGMSASASRTEHRRAPCTEEHRAACSRACVARRRLRAPCERVMRDPSSHACTHVTKREGECSCTYYVPKHAHAHAHAHSYILGSGVRMRTR